MIVWSKLLQFGGHQMVLTTNYVKYGLEFNIWSKIYETKLKFMIKIVAMVSIWWPSSGFAPTHEIELSSK
jgi:hypothetical protein